MFNAIPTGGAAAEPRSARGRLSTDIAASDYIRRSACAVGGRRGHKEWEHFAILAADVDLLVNFSCCDEQRPGAARGAELPRLVLLVRAGGWDGDVETFTMQESRVPAGRVDVRLGNNRLSLDDEGFEIHSVLRDRPVEVELRLRPVTAPAFVPGIPMLDGPPLHWLVVPRLVVDAGRVRIGDRTYVLDGALAYHDHNWGYFAWGHDVAWEWGFVLPDDPQVPWSVTFVRLTNRARTSALSHKVLVWRGEQLAYVFRESDVRAETALHYFRPPSIFKVPRPMALVAPQSATDIPNAIDTRAAVGGDWIECACRPEHLAQVLIPSEADLGVTIFNEVAARAAVRGCIAGESFDFKGKSILEFIRYV